jgi:hypothetical protein
MTERSVALIYALGILTNLGLSQIEPITTCYLTVQFEGELYMGTVLCDGAVCQGLETLLQDHMGKPMQEIGDLDFSAAL